MDLNATVSLKVLAWVVTAIVALGGWGAAIIGGQERVQPQIRDQITAVDARHGSRITVMEQRVAILERNQAAMLFVICSWGRRESLDLPAACREVLR